MDANTKQSAETDKAVNKALAEQNEEHLISYEDAMKVIFCLIAVDQTISEKEIEKFNDIHTGDVIEAYTMEQIEA